MSDATNTPTIDKLNKTDKPATAMGQQKKWFYILFACAVATVAFLIYLIVHLNKVTDYVSNVNALEVYSGSLVKNINDATLSEDAVISDAAYQSLTSDVAGYERALTALSNSAIERKSVYQDLASSWQQQKSSIEFVLENRSNMDDLYDMQQQVEGAVSEMETLYATATAQAIDAGVATNQIGNIQNQVIRLEEMESTFSDLSSKLDASPDAFIVEVQKFVQILTEEQQAFGSQVPALAQIDAIYSERLEPITARINEASAPVIEAREKARSVSDIGLSTQAALADVDRDILARPTIVIPALLALLSLLGAIFALYQLYKVRSASERLLLEKETLRQRQDMEVESDRARKIQEENERNQMAILRLLDELGDLAEGDLTVNATVSEDFTGAIADSVNFAIDQLRQLVLAINTTAVRVAQSSEQTQMTAVELAEASEHQAQEIAGVSAAINEMAVSIDQVSSNASESAAVAQRSVAIAHNGAEVVQRSIEGMNTIREQIQETSKRIKRLGESSQEIGDIVGLINDIADQTNVLALNAAIQASMAGEAGRGFAVVADEVQRLAERSANATKQIEGLVKTIQADTNEAVMSMETTTSEVVRGARLAKDAGEALEEVQAVSNNLADLIQNISNAAQQQASSAGHISKTMNVIQDITSQTSSGTLATARSVGQLNEMASALQESVSGFKLDEDDDVMLQDL